MKRGFSLAEVLITLGVIGVIVAITMPTLINNYKKHEIETKFTQTYNLLSNSLRMASAEYGDLVGIVVSSTNSEIIDNTNKYLLKHVKTIKGGKYTLQDLGYKTPIYYQDGKKIQHALTATSTKYVLINGAVITSVIGSKGTHEGKTLHTIYNYFVDLNGPKGPNTIGRDVFIYMWTPHAGIDIINTGLYGYTVDDTLSIVKSKLFYEHKDMLDNCKTNGGTQCGALIEENGWKIPDDYPLKF